MPTQKGYCEGCSGVGWTVAAVKSVTEGYMIIMLALLHAEYFWYICIVFCCRCLYYVCNARSQTPIQKHHGTRMKATGLTCQTRELCHSGLGHHYV